MHEKFRWATSWKTATWKTLRKWEDNTEMGLMNVDCEDGG